MGFVADLWLPILLSAVAVFVLSSILHMVLKLHSSDYGTLKNEEAVIEGIRNQDVAPGTYFFPGSDSVKEMSSPEMIEKLNQGPVGMMTILPNGPVNMGKNLFAWFLYSIFVGLFCAYLASLTLASPDFLFVFRFVGAAATLAYAVSHVPDSIWKGVSWRVTMVHAFDGILYGLATGAVFAWLWPEIG